MRRSSRLILAALLPAIVIVGVHAFFDPVYRTNDDPGMLLLAAGSVYVDEPTPYLMFSNHVLGGVLAVLYKTAPSVPWYRGLQLFLEWVSTVTLVYLALLN